MLDRQAVINTSEFWSTVADVDYCVVRRTPNFPSAQFGSDIDVLVLDTQEFTLRLQRFWTAQGFQLRVREISNDHVQVDLLSNAARFLMFDLYCADKHLDGVTRGTQFMAWVLARRQKISFGSNSPGLHSSSFFAPSNIDEGVIRYVEYVTSFWTGRLKDWHLEWIEGELSRDERSKMLELAHYFYGEGARPQNNAIQRGALSKSERTRSFLGFRAS